jgi:hypothetical protein
LNGIFSGPLSIEEVVYTTIADFFLAGGKESGLHPCVVGPLAEKHLNAYKNDQHCIDGMFWGETKMSFAVYTAVKDFEQGSRPRGFDCKFFLDILTGSSFG